MDEPLRITFTFCSPVVRDSEYLLHADALLAWCRVNEAESEGNADAWAAGDDLSHLLAKAESEGGWVWKASALHFKPASEKFMMSMIRKSEPLEYMYALDRGFIQIRRERTYINTMSGQERAYQFLHTYQWMEKAEAWVIGKRAEITKALTRLTAIGKLTRNGFGVLREIKVAPDEEAQTLWRVRILPTGMDGDRNHEYIPTLQCLRAPYWKKMSRVMAQEPVL
jgi:CRISPR type IV-associated protein Csf3